MRITNSSDSTLVVDGQLIQQSLVVTAALPQVITAGALYLLLGIAALIVSLRTPGAPFTLTGILMMHSKLVALWVSTENTREGEEKDKLL
jgi:membrane protein implicated in regulation of membrane protease activity